MSFGLARPTSQGFDAQRGGSADDCRRQDVEARRPRTRRHGERSLAQGVVDGGVQIARRGTAHADAGRQLNCVTRPLILQYRGRPRVPSRLAAQDPSFSSPAIEQPLLERFMLMGTGVLGSWPGACDCQREFTQKSSRQTLSVIVVGVRAAFRPSGSE